MTDRDGTEAVLTDLTSQLAREVARKTSLEQRAVTVITTSSVLATIVFTATAAITKTHGAANFTTTEHVLIAIAVGLFLTAGVCALVVNVPRRYYEIDTQSITDVATWVDENRASDANTYLGVTDRLVAKGIDDLKTWQDKNRMKAIVLSAAFLFEVGAVLFLLIALIKFIA